MILPSGLDEASNLSVHPRDYYQRAAESDTAALDTLDINHDGVVDQSEAAGDVDF